MIQRLANRQRLPRIGKIRLGVKVAGQNGKEYPKEVDYFVVDPSLAEALGEEKPKRLSVMFPSDDIEKILPNRYERYAGGLLTLECDGENAVEIPLKGSERRFACERPMGEPGKPTPECPCGAKAKGQLNVIVLGGGIGTYQITVGGEQRLADLLTQLHIYRETFGSLKTVNGHPIPFELVRVPQTSQIRKGGEDGERMTREGYPVKIVCHFTAEQALEARGMRLLAVGEGSVKQLTQGAIPSTVEVDSLGLGTLHDPPAPQNGAVLDDPDADVLGHEADPSDRLAGLRTDLETIFSDCAGGNRTKALNLIRKTCTQHLGRPVNSLADLAEHELLAVMEIMSR